MGLDLSDVLGLHFLRSLSAMRHHFVLQGLLLPVRVLDHRIVAPPMYQGLQLVTAGRRGLALLQEVLRAEVQSELKKQTITFVTRPTNYSGCERQNTCTQQGMSSVI